MAYRFTKEHVQGLRARVNNQGLKLKVDTEDTLYVLADYAALQDRLTSVNERNKALRAQLRNIQDKQAILKRENASLKAKNEKAKERSAELV